MGNSGSSDTLKVMLNRISYKSLHTGHDICSYMCAETKSKAEAKQASRKRKTPTQEEQEAAADAEAAGTSAKKGKAPKAEAYKLPEVGSSLLSSSACSLTFQNKCPR